MPKSEKTSLLRAGGLTLHYRKGDNDTVRVWRENWFRDQFEVLEPESFMKLLEFCLTFSIPIQKHYSDED